MLKAPEDLAVGRWVWLYPHTKTASRLVQSQRKVQVAKNPAAHWPRVMVTWDDPDVEGTQWELVHKDNIRLTDPAGRVKADEKEGDNARDNAGMSRWAKVRPIGPPLKEIDLPDGNEQGELF